MQHKKIKQISIKPKTYESKREQHLEDDLVNKKKIMRIMAIALIASIYLYVNLAGLFRTCRGAMYLAAAYIPLFTYIILTGKRGKGFLGYLPFVLLILLICFLLQFVCQKCT